MHKELEIDFRCLPDFADLPERELPGEYDALESNAFEETDFVDIIVVRLCACEER